MYYRVGLQVNDLGKKGQHMGHCLNLQANKRMLSFVNQSQLPHYSVQHLMREAVAGHPTATAATPQAT